MSLQDKTSLFFMDYSIVPKFVQENYLNINTFAAKGASSRSTSNRGSSQSPCAVVCALQVT